VLAGPSRGARQIPNFSRVLEGRRRAARSRVPVRVCRHGQADARDARAGSRWPVAEYYHSETGIAMHSRTHVRRASRSTRLRWARQFTSNDPREAALLSYIRCLLDESGRTPGLHEEGPRGGGTTSSSSRPSPRWRSRRSRRGQRRRRGPVDGSSAASRPFMRRSFAADGRREER